MSKLDELRKKYLKEEEEDDEKKSSSSSKKDETDSDKYVSNPIKVEAGKSALDKLKSKYVKTPTATNDDVTDWFKKAETVFTNYSNYDPQKYTTNYGGEDAKTIDELINSAGDMQAFLVANPEYASNEELQKSFSQTYKNLIKLSKSTFDINRHYSKWANEREYEAYKGQMEILDMSPTEYKAKATEAEEAKKDSETLHRISQALIPYDEETAMANGVDRQRYEDFKYDVDYICQKYGVTPDWLLDYGDNINQLWAKVDKIAEGIALTTPDGTNYTWKKLYDDAAFERDAFQKYDMYSNREDWAENSKAIQYVEDMEKVGFESDFNIVNTLQQTNVPWDYDTAMSQGISKEKYDKIMGYRNYIQTKYGVDLNTYDDVKILNDIMAKVEHEADEQFSNYNQLTKEEKEILSYIWTTKGRHAAWEWYNQNESRFDQRYQDTIRETSAYLGENMPVFGTALSFVTSGLSGLEYVADGIDYLVTGEDQYNSLANITSSTRGGVMAGTDWKIGDWDAFDFLYGTGTSIVDSMAMSAVPGGHLVLAGSAAAQGYNDAIDRGLSQGQAFATGFANGVAEGFFEKWSIGKFKALKEVPSATGKDISLNVLKSMGVNASEEAATEIANYIYDRIANGGFSQYETTVRMYEAQGYTTEEAEAMATDQVKRQVREAAASGLLMGAVMGGGASVRPALHNIASSVKTSRANSNVAKGTISANGGTAALRNLANEIAGVSDSKMQNRLNKQSAKVEGDASVKNVKNLYKTIGKATNALNQADIAKSLERQGFSTKEANAVAGAIVASQRGQLLSNKQSTLLEKYGDSAAVKAVLENIVSNSQSTMGQRNSEMAEFTQSAMLSKAVDTIIKKAQKAQKSSEGKSVPQSKNVIQSKFESNTEGETINTKKGENVEIVGVTSIKDGELTLKVKNSEGETENINAKDLSLSQSDALIYSAIVDMDVSPASAWNIAKNFKESDGVSAEVYAADAPIAYRYGVLNYREGLSKLDLTTDQAMTAFYQGRNDSDAKLKTEAKKSIVAKKDSKKKTTSKGEAATRIKGKVVFEGFEYDENSANDLQKASMAGIKLITEMSSLEVHVYKSFKENGKFYAYIDGKKRLAPNGYFKEGTNKIYIDLNAGMNGEGLMLDTAGHEIGHYMADNDWDAFKEYADFLFENYGPDVPVDELINRQKQRIIEGHKMDGKAIPSEDKLFRMAYVEVVCDASTKMLADENAYLKLAELKKQNKTLWEKIGEAIKNLLDKLKSVIGMYSNQTTTSEAMYVEQFSKEVFDKLQDLYLKAFVKADENFNSIGARNLEDLSAAKNTDGESLFQYRAMEADEAIYRDMLIKWGKMTNTQVDNLFTTIDRAMDIIKDNLEVLDYAWDADIDDRAFSPVKPNSDSLYQVSLDFSTLCRKRILQQTIITHLQEALNQPISREEGIAIRDALIALQEEGRQIEVACALCYVESARMKSPAQIKKFLNNREAVLKDFFAGKSGGSMKAKIKQAEVDAREKLHKENPNGIKGKDGSMLDPRTASLKAMPKKYADTIRDAKRAAKESYKPTAEEQKLIDVAKGMTVSDFTSPEGLENLAKNYPSLFDAYTSYIRNATKSKGIEGDTWWRAGDSAKIGDVLIANMNKENGLRSQSWSDFQVVHILDYIASTIELSTRNVKEQAYSKVPDYIELMGQTGVMLNMSLIPTAEFNGTLEYDSVEGMAYKRALELRDKYPNTAGTICIGVNNEQIKMLLADITIDYVIPYHKSGMAASIRKLMHIPTWDQYEDYQSEKELSDAEAKKNAEKYGVKLLDKSDPNYHKHTAFSEWFDLDVAKQIAKMENANPSNKAMQKKYGVMYGGYMAMQNAADNYLKLCAERGLSPKFSHKNADFTAEDNYWKLLIDRKMVNNATGEIIEQQTIKPIFDEGEVLRILNDELERYPSVKADQEYATRTVVDKFLSGEIKSGMSAEAIAKVVKKPVDNITNTNIVASAEEGNLYSEREIIGVSGTNYGMGVYLDSSTLIGLTDLQRKSKVQEFVINKLAGNSFIAYDDNNKAIDVNIAKETDVIKNKKGKKRKVIEELYKKNNFLVVKQEAVVLADELIKNAKHESTLPSKYSHGWLDNYGKNDWEYWDVFIQEKNNAVWKATLNIATTQNGKKLLYDIDPIIMVEGSVESVPTSTNGIIQQDNTKSQAKIYDRDSDYMDAVNNGDMETAQRLVDEAAKQSGAILDDNGKPLKLFRGTKGGQTVFSKETTLNGKIYTIDNINIATKYGDKSGKATAIAHQTDGEKTTYALYGFPTNMLTIDAQYGVWSDLVVPEELLKYSDGKYKATNAEIAEWAEMEGYDALQIDNVRDGSFAAGSEIIFFNENLVKSADAITNDNSGNVIPLSQRFNSENDDIRYQERDTDSVSNRSLLANSLESAAQNDIERNKLTLYKEKISLIEAEEQRLSEIQKQLFTKDGVDSAKRKELQFEAKQISNRINTYDRQLLNLEATTALKNVLNREKEMARKRQKQKDAENLKAYKEKVAKTQRELLDKWQTSRKNAIEGRNKTALRHKIKGVVGELNQLLLKGTKDKHVMIGLQKAVAEALDAVNMDTVGADERLKVLSEKIAKETDVMKLNDLLSSYRRIMEQGDRMNERLTALKNAYNEIKNSDDPLIANSYDEVITSRIEAVVEKVGNTPLRDMTLAQLEDVYDMYKMVLTVIRNSNKAFKSAKNESIATLGNRVMMEVEKVGGNHPLSRKALEGIKSFGWNTLKPAYAFRLIGSDTLTDIYNNVRQGEDTWARDVSEARDFYREKTKKYNFDSWDFKKTRSFTSTSGKNFELSLEQIMSLYAYSKREQADLHLQLGGFVFDSSIEVTKKSKLGIPLKYTVKTADAYNLSQETLGDIIGTLSAEQKAFVDEMQGYLSTVMGEKGNEVSLEMYGVKLFKEKNYFPLKSAKQFMFEQSESAGEVRIKNSGFSKETVAKANNPIILNNFTDVWTNHVNDMSMYHAFVLALEDFNRVYNYKTPTSDNMATESVKMFLQNAYGNQASQYIKQLITDLNGGVRVDPAADPINKGIGAFKKAAVFASASVVIQQPSAIARALSLIDSKYFVTRIGIKDHSKIWSEVKKYAPVAIIKEMGRFDTHIGQQTTDWIKSTEYKGIGQKTKALFTDSAYRDDVLSKAPALADEIAWCYIWNAVKKETKATTKLQVGSEEFLKKCGERFTEIVTLTQVYDSVLSRSGQMRSKDTGMKMATAFMAEPTTSMNMMVDAMIQGKRGNKRYTRKTVGAVASSIILNSILVSLVYAARDDDEDETYTEKYIGSLVSELLDGFNPLTYIPFVKDVWSIAQGYDVERSDMSLYSKLWQSVENLFNENLSAEDKVKDFAGTVLNLFGLPAKNIMRDVDAMFNLTNDFMSGTQTTGAGIIDSIEDSLRSSIPLLGRFYEEDSNAKKLYDAIISGDEVQIERVKNRFKDDKAIESALRKALRENDPRIIEAAQARIDGDIARYTSLVKEIKSEGHFVQDTIVAAINAEINAINKGEGTTQTPAEDKEESIYKMDDLFAAIANGDRASANTVRDDMIKIDVANGKSQEDAEENFNGRVTSQCREEYESGNLTGREVEDILVNYGGKTEEEAANKVLYWDFKEDYPDVEMSEEALVKYYDQVESSGISMDVYVDYYERQKECKGVDADGDGKTDSGSKKAQILKVINSLPISKSQKDVLYYLNGWAKSTINEAPWH